MNCPTCGKENYTDAVFCRHCGSKLIVGNEPIIHQAKPSSGKDSISHEDRGTRRKRGRILALLGVGVLLVVLLLVVLPLGNRKSKESPASELSNEPLNDSSYAVFLDRTGGINGTINIRVAYDSVMPYATAPTKSGYRFRGYYDLPNGQGTMYYNAEMQCAHDWDKEEGGTLYAYWEKQSEKVFSKDSMEGDPVYIDIEWIFPRYGLYYSIIDNYTDFVCECKTTSQATVWILMPCEVYREEFDSTVSTEVIDPSFDKEVRLNPSRRIHGTVIKSNSIIQDFSYKTASMIIEYESID